MPFLNLVLSLLQLSLYLLFLLCSKCLKKVVCICHLHLLFFHFIFSHLPTVIPLELVFIKVTGAVHGVKPMSILRLTFINLLIAFDMIDHPLLLESLSALGLGTSLLILALFTGHPSLYLLLDPPYLPKD